MKNFKWMYFFIWVALVSTVLSIIIGLVTGTDIVWQICSLGWIGCSYFLQKRVEELEKKD